ncbi:hypothetical protein Ancab_032564 [Ancistrocladus abbreviatus]
MAGVEIAAFCSQMSVYRPGMDITKAELVSRTNWRRQEKIKNMGEWKQRSEQILPLELDEDSEGGFLVAENPSFGGDFSNKRPNSSFIV